MMYGFGYGMGLWGVFFMVLFWALIIAAVVWLVRALANPTDANRDDSALDVLNGRYVRGEISREEFQKMKKDLA